MVILICLEESLKYFKLEILMYYLSAEESSDSGDCSAMFV